jgi:hypothetical protein
MKALELFAQLGYTHNQNADAIKYTLNATLDSDLELTRTITITFDIIKGYYFIEGLVGTKSMIVKMTAPLHYAISKQLKELGWIEVGI